jgi:hypothetical protein
VALRKLQADDVAESTTSAPLVTLARSARGKRFAQMFPHEPLTMGGFQSLEEFLATVHSGLADPRLVPIYATHQTDVGSAGGFSVPNDLQRMARFVARKRDRPASG